MSDPVVNTVLTDVPTALIAFKAQYSEFLVETGDPPARNPKYSDVRITQALTIMRSIYVVNEPGYLVGAAHILYVNAYDVDPSKPPHEGRGTTETFRASELEVERVTQATKKPYNAYWARSPYGELFIEIRDEARRQGILEFS